MFVKHYYQNVMQLIIMYNLYRYPGLFKAKCIVTCTPGDMCVTSARLPDGIPTQLNAVAIYTSTSI